MSVLKRSLWMAGSVALAAGSASASSTYILQDGNSETRIDPLSSAGQYDWLVDGLDHVAQQWFWFRIGQTAEQPINVLPVTGGPALIDTNPFDDPRMDTLSLRYSDDRVQFEPTFVLRGGTAGSNVSDVAEVIRITNLTSEEMHLTFFQYADFDLNPGFGLGDSVQVLSANNVVQTNGLYTMHETIVNPPATAFEANFFANTLNALNDAFATNLNGNALAGPGDVTWAFQWDFVIPAGATVIVSKDKQLVPTPGAFALVGAAGALSIRRRRR